LSFHNAKGDIMTTTTDATDPSVLLPVVNGVLANCRKKDVKFVCIQLTINYAPLVNVTPPGAMVLRTEYYIELPQTSVQVTDGAGNAYNLLTFHGPADLRTMSPAEVQAQILDVTFQDGPVDLQPSKFKLSSARTDSSEMCSDNEGRIVWLASAMVWHTMFLELCPGYSMQPLPPLITSARCSRTATEIKLSARYRPTSNSSWEQLTPSLVNETSQ
jgi:hypothetical protein